MLSPNRGDGRPMLTSATKAVRPWFLADQFLNRVSSNRSEMIRLILQTKESTMAKKMSVNLPEGTSVDALSDDEIRDLVEKAARSAGITGVDEVIRSSARFNLRSPLVLDRRRRWRSSLDTNLHMSTAAPTWDPVPKSLDRRHGSYLSGAARTDRTACREMGPVVFSRSVPSRSLWTAATADGSSFLRRKHRSLNCFSAADSDSTRVDH